MAQDSVYALRLKHLRESKRPVVNATITSELIGLAPGTLRRYERGVRIPKLEEIRMIADFYEVSVDYILGRTDKREVNRG